jgi:hypothetical protein
MITADSIIEEYLVLGSTHTLTTLEAGITSVKEYNNIMSFTKNGMDKFVNSLWRAEEFLEVWLTTEESFYDNRRNY